MLNLELFVERKEKIYFRRIRHWFLEHRFACFTREWKLLASGNVLRVRILLPTCLLGWESFRHAPVWENWVRVITHEIKYEFTLRVKSSGILVANMYLGVTANCRCKDQMDFCILVAFLSCGLLIQIGGNALQHVWKKTKKSTLKE